MKLSVITSVYNSEKYLKDSLDSLLSQDQEFVLYLIDDGSEDNSYSIMDKYKGRFNNCVLIKNTKNKGIAYSRNKCLSMINTEYVAIHDSDDISLPSRFSKQINYLDSYSEVDVVGGFAHKIDLNNHSIGDMTYPSKNSIGCIISIIKYKLNPIIDPSCMYRYKSIVNVGGYNMNEEIANVSDFDLWCRLLSLGYNISNIEDFLINYRINPNGVTISKHKKVREATDIVWAKFKNKNYNRLAFDKNFFQEDSQLFSIN